MMSKVKKVTTGNFEVISKMFISKIVPFAYIRNPCNLFYKESNICIYICTK